MDRLAAPGTPARPSPTHAPAAARTLLAEAVKEARRGVDLVGEVVALLDRRSTAPNASRLREITSALDTFAVRARVLALEAALEASLGRAGFAEVAVALRTLARRCDEALDEIRALPGYETVECPIAGVTIIDVRRAIFAPR